MNTVWCQRIRISWICSSGFRGGHLQTSCASAHTELPLVQRTADDSEVWGGGDIFCRVSALTSSQGMSVDGCNATVSCVNSGVPLGRKPLFFTISFMSFPLEVFQMWSIMFFTYARCEISKLYDTWYKLQCGLITWLMWLGRVGLRLAFCLTMPIFCFLENFVLSTAQPISDIVPTDTLIIYPIMQNRKIFKYNWLEDTLIVPIGHIHAINARNYANEGQSQLWRGAGEMCWTKFLKCYIIVGSGATGCWHVLYQH